MNSRTASLIASLILSLLPALKAQSADVESVTCWRSEYVKVVLTDGVRHRHTLFASTPCQFMNPLHDAWKADDAKPAGKLDPEWVAFRFRSNERPDSPGYPKFEYLGESGPLSPRSFVVALTKDMEKELAAGKLHLENTPASLRHAIMVFRKGKPISEVIEMSKTANIIQEYSKTHLVLVAFPENTWNVKK